MVGEIAFWSLFVGGACAVAALGIVQIVQGLSGLGYRLTYSRPRECARLTAWLAFSWRFEDSSGTRVAGVRIFGVEIERRGR